MALLHKEVVQFNHSILVYRQADKIENFFVSLECSPVLPWVFFLDHL